MLNLVGRGRCGGRDVAGGLITYPLPIRQGIRDKAAEVPPLPLGEAGEAGSDWAWPRLGRRHPGGIGDRAPAASRDTHRMSMI